MATIEPLPATPPDPVWPESRRFSIDEYHRLVEAGIIGEKERVELLEGVIVRMRPQNEPGVRALMCLNRLLIRSLGDEYLVRPQVPMTFPSSQSEPEPDLAVVRALDAPSRHEHPQTALLAIEISISLRFDRKIKGRIYARAGVPEYWVVNVEDRCVEVFRDPNGGAGVYLTTFTALPEDTLVPSAVPGLCVPVAPIFA